MAVPWFQRPPRPVYRDLSTLVVFSAVFDVAAVLVLLMLGLRLEAGLIVASLVFTLLAVLAVRENIQRLIDATPTVDYAAQLALGGAVNLAIRGLYVLGGWWAGAFTPGTLGGAGPGFTPAPGWGGHSWWTIAGHALLAISVFSTMLTAWYCANDRRLDELIAQVRGTPDADPGDDDSSGR